MRPLFKISCLLSLVWLSISVAVCAKAIPAGRYSGIYSCTQGKTSATLEVFDRPRNGDGRFIFEKGRIFGSFLVSFEEDGDSVKVLPNGWERRPSGYAAVSIRLRQNGNSLEGEVLSPTCGEIKLTMNYSAVMVYRPRITSSSIDLTKNLPQLSDSKQKLVDGCRANDKSECRRVVEFVSSRFPEHKEAAIRGCGLKIESLCRSAALVFLREKLNPDRLEFAAKYFKLGCEYGDGDSCGYLGAGQGDAGIKARAELVRDNIASCNSGDGRACMFAGGLLSASNGSEAEKASALKYISLGCKLGYEYSCEELKLVIERFRIEQRNKERSAAELAAKSNPNYNSFVQLSAFDLQCLRTEVEKYSTDELGSCKTYDVIGETVAGMPGKCIEYYHIITPKTRVKLKNVCRRAITFRENCGIAARSHVTLIFDDVYTRSSPLCELTY